MPSPVLHYQDSLVSIYHGDAADVNLLVQDTAQLIFTSPPYNIGKKYRTFKDLQGWGQYRAMLVRFLQASADTLRVGGICAINLPFTLRRSINHKVEIVSGYGLLLDIISEIRDLEYRDTIIWAKRDNNSLIYNSHVAIESNPYLAPVCEPILLCSKWGSSKMKRKEHYWGHRELPKVRNLWYFSDVSKSRDKGRDQLKHVAAFPIELADAIIAVYTEKGDLVIDPMCGNGTTLMAAKRMERCSIGVDIDQVACNVASLRCRQESIPSYFDESAERVMIEKQILLPMSV